ncbi:MAG TPA: hypothetical protein DEH78_00325 [Solibacterales bacterium]|nr:hypothetical protein [Bryobacterales bacterium]
MPDELYLVFRAAGEEFALPAAQVREIVTVHDCTDAVNVRGAVLPVVAAARVPAKRGCVIVVEARERRLGLLVDRIASVVKIEPEKISSNPDPPSRRLPLCRVGRVRLHGRFKHVLDPNLLPACLPDAS